MGRLRPTESYNAGSLKTTFSKDIEQCKDIKECHHPGNSTGKQPIKEPRF